MATPLAGQWELDLELTKVSSLAANATDTIKNCYKKGGCGQLALKHTNDQVRTFKYNITIVETYLDGSHYTVGWAINDNIACMPVQFDSISYQQCFHKAHNVFQKEKK